MIIENKGRVGFVMQGAYDNDAEYIKLDVVTYNGSLYGCKENTTPGITPDNTAYWVRMIDNTGKLDVNIGAENAGKTLEVDALGNIIPGDPKLIIDPSLSVGGQAADAYAVGSKMGDLDNLQTPAKNSLVDAINSVAPQALTPDQIDSILV